VLAVGKLLLRCRLLGRARRFDDNGGRGAGHIVAAARLQLVFVVSFYIFYSAVLLCYGRHFSGLLAFGVINDDDDDDNLAVDTEA